MNKSPSSLPEHSSQYTVWESMKANQFARWAGFAGLIVVSVGVIVAIAGRRIQSPVSSAAGVQSCADILPEFSLSQHVPVLAGEDASYSLVASNPSCMPVEVHFTVGASPTGLQYTATIDPLTLAPNANANTVIVAKSPQNSIPGTNYVITVQPTVLINGQPVNLPLVSTHHIITDLKSS